MHVGKIMSVRLPAGSPSDTIESIYAFNKKRLPIVEKCVYKNMDLISIHTYNPQ
jgi:hypothetical protein